MDRSLLYEYWLDNLELYMNFKHDLDKKVKVEFAGGNYDTDSLYWEEYEMLEHLRELSRRALDEYVSSKTVTERTQEEAGTGEGPL